LRCFHYDDRQKKQLGLEQSELYRAPRFSLSQPIWLQLCKEFLAGRLRARKITAQVGVVAGQSSRQGLLGLRLFLEGHHLVLVGLVPDLSKTTTDDYQSLSTVSFSKLRLMIPL
jgi:hypothetical protein